MAPSSDSAADDMTFFIIYVMVSMAPFFCENTVLFDKKSCRRPNCVHLVN